ncbi:hypothetical protein FGG08_001760 [Glutinoglossum americanum]|uniref:U3 small nucleolar RNA-associated protein 22 n=1 Tax=Glutinoglossum americanum TaxID=1670608 RepID=A0A9P8L623_9PEZI|nr:hypothetical protein FGG08_001760 [Glutinoglossum americanum]
MDSHATKKRKVEHSDGSRSANRQTTHMDGQRHSTKLVKNHTAWDAISKDSQLLAGEMYKSSMFKLQLDELLDEVQPSYKKRMVPVENALRKLKSIIERIPDREPVGANEAEKELYKRYKIAIPFMGPRLAKDVKYKLAYSRPANINVVGSYALKTAVKARSVISVDMAITLPSSIFQEKDYLNYRYFHKRAYYLACLAAGIIESKDSKFKIKFSYLNGNNIQPIVIISSCEDGGVDDFSSSKCDIHILPTISGDVFPATKLLPNKNCVRQSENSSGTTPAHTPTPFYNATLKSECSITPYLKLFHHTSSYCGSYKDACVLGRIWLQQRGFEGDISKGGFGHFEWAAISAALLQDGGARGQRLLSPGYSSYQLFKAMLQFLASTDLAANPLIFQAEEFDARKLDVPIFYDGPRGVNVLFKMTSWSYQMLRHEAGNSLDMLRDIVADNFEASFIVKANDPLLRFDLLARIPISPELLLHSRSVDCEPGVVHFCRKLYQVLSRGMGDRVTLIYLSIPGTDPWCVKAPTPCIEGQACVLVGFLLNPTHAGRVVDHGPPAEAKKEAAAFRKFWGEKAELRRFKDGSILESLVWSDKESKTPIFQQVVLYLLDRNFGSDIAKAAAFVGDNFSGLIAMQGASGMQTIAKFQPAMADLDKLERDIRGLEGLPLQLSQISATSPKLRYASIDLPLESTRVGAPADLADVVLLFEGSGRWPDDLAAIQRTKAAFLLKMAEMLEESIEGVSARTGLESGGSSLRNISFLDVVYKAGAAFRLRIYNEREQTLLERLLKNKSLEPRKRDEAILAQSEYKRIFIHSRSHTQALQILCTRFAYLSPTIRLVKLWFASHLLSRHVSEELTELCVVRVFLQPYPWEPPSSVMTGFLRTLLWLSRWDWRLDPLIVDFSGEMKARDVDVIKTRFEAWRKIDPGMNRVVLFVASNLDPEGLTWTQFGPSKVVAARVTALARSACAVSKEAGLEINPEALFIPSTADYDFIIHINSRFTNDRRGERPSAKHPLFKNLQIQSDKETNAELIGYNPVELFLDELRELYSNNIVFFYNAHGGTFIGGLWSPHITSQRSWKVNLSYSTTPIVAESETNDDCSEKAARLIVNKTAILNEIGRLGGDMVMRIESRN